MNPFFWAFVVKREADRKQRAYVVDEQKPDDLVTAMELGCDKA